MKVKNLNTYDYIMIWGAGQQFQSRFRNQFKVDYLIDKKCEKKDKETMVGIR